MTSDGFDQDLFDALIRWEQCAFWIAWYKLHAGPGGDCRICEIPGPCPRWSQAQRRLDDEGLIDEKGNLRDPHPI